MKDLANRMLVERGVNLEDICKLVLAIQLPHLPNLTLENCLKSVEKVIEKREVINAIITGITIDQLAEKNLINEPLATLLKTDDSLYGIDEILALSIVNIYGTIGLTNFGYLDKTKPGIIGHLNNKTSGQVNTFLDDIVCAIAAASASSLAHRERDKLEAQDFILKAT